MILGDRLRKLREEKKLSQGDIKKRTGLLRAYISRVEHGQTAGMDPLLGAKDTGSLLGNRLRKLREEKKLSQGDIEKRTGLLRAYISRVEHGHTVPAIEKLDKLVHAMDVSLYQFFYEGEEPPRLPNLTKQNMEEAVTRTRSGKRRKQRMPSWSRITLKLEEQGKLDHFDPKPLGKLVHVIVKEGSKEESRAAFQQWLQEYGNSWLVEKRPALASVIEAAAQLSLPGTERFVAKVLAYKHAESNVASIAAQRVRLFPITDPKLKKELWQSLKYWIEFWLEQPKAEELAVLAVPSVPIIAQSDAVPWLCEILRNSPRRVAWSTALGILEWASRKPVRGFNDEIAEVLSTAIINRYHREVESPSLEADQASPLLSALVWVLGATSTEKQLSKVALILADSFRRAQNLEDAAALRAGRILVRRWREKSLQALSAAFGGCNSNEFLRYNAALLLEPIS